ncbi:MAG TPA: hypothetical protein VK489_04415, partial [Ferruginibacter sp.]|nr:hypothetical protein [Ferruginibacter sp.]
KSVFTPDHSLTSTASVCFDAVYVASGKRSADVLKTEPAAILFVNEAYKHCKAVAFGKETEGFSALTNIKKDLKDPALIMEGKTKFPAAFVTAIANHRVWDLEDARNNPS